MHIEIADEEQTVALAHVIVPLLRDGDVVVLEGGLGAGKTTFVRAIARALGLPADEPVTSPTFAVVQEYETCPRLIHADLYRLAHSDELLQLGLDESLGRHGVAFIEWGLGHLRSLPHVDLLVTLSSIDCDARRFEIEGRSSRGDDLVSALQIKLRDHS